MCRLIRDPERTYTIPHLEGKTLNVFRHNGFYISTFEDYLPNQVDKVSSDHDPHPPESHTSPPMWHKEGYKYYAYLPKNHGAVLNYHLFSCLGETQIVKDNGWFCLDNTCTKIWSSLEKNLMHSIQCIKNMGLLVSVEDVKPPLAEHYGYLWSHLVLGGLSYCLRKC